MRRGLIIIFYFFFVIGSSCLLAQDSLFLDSLQKELVATTDDSVRLELEYKLEEARWNMRPSYWDSLAKRARKLGLRNLETNCLNNLGFIYMNQGQVAKALTYHQQCITNFKQLKDQKGIAMSLNNMGYLYQHTGEIERALEYYNKSLEIREGIEDFPGIGESLINIGFIYQDLGEIKKSLDYYHEALGIYEVIKDQLGIATALNNIASIYSDQGELDKTLKYYTNCLSIRQELGNKIDIANSLNNIGSVYRRMKDPDKALDYVIQSYQLQHEVSNSQGESLALHNIGTIYHQMGDYENALPHFKEALKVREELGDKKAIAQSLFSIGEIYLYLDDNDQAVACGKRALKLSYELGFPQQIRDAARLLSKVYKRAGNSELALQHYEIYVSMRDSIFNDATKRAAIRKEMQYEFEKEMIALQIEQEKRELVSSQEQEQQRWIIFSVSIGLGLVVLFVIFLTNRIRVIRNQKRVIENHKEDLEIQKSLVDEKNKDITDSIRYARRIQKAILPEEEYVRKLLPEHFILFQPKDIVSGDFYWLSENKRKVFFAVCDCTGHGVPGAFMSMIGTSLLNEVVNEKGVSTPGSIFDEVRSGFISALKQTTDDVEQKDGMDAILCSLDQDMKLEFSAAYNPLLLIRDGELKEFKGDAQPVGFHGGVEKPFSTHIQPLKKDDVIYLITDGFQDQFGGPKGKKFKSKKLKNLLLEVHGLPMAEQRQKLIDVFDEWKGDQDQVDDVCIMGMRM